MNTLRNLMSTMITNTKQNEMQFLTLKIRKKKNNTFYFFCKVSHMVEKQNNMRGIYSLRNCALIPVRVHPIFPLRSSLYLDNQFY